MTAASAHLATCPTAASTAASSPTTAGDGSLAYLTHVLANDAGTPEERRSEFVAHAYSPQGTLFADQLAAAIRSWDLRVRGHGYPQLTVYSAVTDPGAPSEGMVLDKRHCQLVFDWNADKL